MVRRQIIGLIFLSVIASSQLITINKPKDRNCGKWYNSHLRSGTIKDNRILKKTHIMYHQRELLLTEKPNILSWEILLYQVFFVREHLVQKTWIVF